MSFLTRSPAILEFTPLADFSFGTDEKQELLERQDLAAQKHEAALTHEKSEIIRLKRETEELKAAHAKALEDASTAAVAEKKNLELELQKYKGIAEEAERNNQAWLSQLNKINSEMSSKLPFLGFSSLRVLRHYY